MAYEPDVGDEVLVDMSVLRDRRAKRLGTIINRVQRCIASHEYETIYVIRTGFGDVVHARLGEFVQAYRRHIKDVM